MDTTESQVLPAPPNLVKSLMAGFDAISSHIGIILFSLALDLFLWVGPRIQITTLIQAIFARLLLLPDMQSPEMLKMMEASRDVWLDIAQRFNLFSLLRSYPVGIPSLMLSRSPLAGPLGQPDTWQVPSFGLLLLIWLGLTLFGLVVGALYFALIAQAAIEGKVAFGKALREWPWNAYQVIRLALVWLGIALLASLPFTCMLSLLIGGASEMGRLFLLLYGGLIAWLLLPLVFSPHGIFVYRLPTFASLRQGIRLARITLPSTVLFLLMIIILSEGLDLLWRVPQENSWLSAIGIIGHSFVTAGLLAASFIYYHDAGQWVQRIRQKANLARIRHS